MYGYIYKTINLINNKIYIGQKHADKFLAESYLGSGKLLREAVEKYGKETFKVELLDTAETPEELDEKEIYWISELKATDRSVGYNICDGGLVYRAMTGKNNPFYGKTHTEDVKKQIGEKNSDWLAENKKQHSDQIKIGMKIWWENLSSSEQEAYKITQRNNNSGENNPMFGKNHSAETRAKIGKKHYDYLHSRPANWVDPAQTVEAREKRRQSLKGHTVSEETRKKLSEFNKSHCWVCTADNKIQILKTDIDYYLKQGYQFGKKWRDDYGKEYKL